MSVRQHFHLYKKFLESEKQVYYALILMPDGKYSAGRYSCFGSKRKATHGQGSAVKSVVLKKTMREKSIDDK